MEGFFRVWPIDRVLELVSLCDPVETEEVPIEAALNRVLAEDVLAEEDLPGFRRATMDGFAVQASATFGATEANPAYLNLIGSVAMGEVPTISVGAGEAVRISTGGMLPQGADAVIMVEYAEMIDDVLMEVYRSVAPGQNVMMPDEDFRKGEPLVSAGRRLRPQEIGTLAAFGKGAVRVYRKPRVAIVSTGDEVVPIDCRPAPGQIRDVNTYTLAGFVEGTGGMVSRFGLVPDRFDRLLERCLQALDEADMVMLSGGSSVGMRDLTIDVLEAVPESRILLHGIAISPGKPTILATCGSKLIWGLPGQVTSAMVVFLKIVRPFLERLCGLDASSVVRRTVEAVLTRNVASVQGRTDFIRVRLRKETNGWMADPVLGKSGLIHTMMRADGLVEIGMNTEGLEEGARVTVEWFD
uniref:Molybdopterin molybdenumtransferase n=1 Tax=Desulfatirhabdium butyrativorans TaxID=340467 RepID=A0A7C4RQY4_9BACT